MNPLKFVDEVRQEVAKVTWPTPKEVWITTVMVLIMVAHRVALLHGRRSRDRVGRAMGARVRALRRVNSSW